MMNLKQVPQPMERLGIGKRISHLWNSRNRVARLIMLATLGLVLNCCCIIIPIPHSSTGNTLAAQSDVSVNVISSPAFTTARDHFIPMGFAISANTGFDNNGAGWTASRNFNSQATAWKSAGMAYIHLDGGDKGGRAYKSLP